MRVLGVFRAVVGYVKDKSVNVCFAVRCIGQIFPQYLLSMSWASWLVGSFNGESIGMFSNVEWSCAGYRIKSCPSYLQFSHASSSCSVAPEIAILPVVVSEYFPYELRPELP